MNIVILGAGNMGCAMAADLTLKGHCITLVKTSHAMHNDTFSYLKANNNRLSLFENGQTKTAEVHRITTDLQAISEADLIIITVQTNYHEKLIVRMKEYLRKGQKILVVPGYLSTAYFLKHCPELDLVIIEGESSTIDCRVDDVGKVRVGFRNVRNPVGVYPQKYTQSMVEFLAPLQYHYTALSSVVEAALHNPNLIVHTVGAIMSIPRIEKTKGEYCMYHEVFTPSVWNILERLDSEKMDVLEKLGYERLAYVDACKYRNSLDESIDGKAVFFEYAAMPTRAKGPTTVDSRYILEDVSQGLVLLEALGGCLGLKTPVSTSLIEIASAALSRDLRAEGRSLEGLGKERVQRVLADCGHLVNF